MYHYHICELPTFDSSVSLPTLSVSCLSGHVRNHVAYRHIIFLTLTKHKSHPQSLSFMAMILGAYRAYHA